MTRFAPPLIIACPHCDGKLQKSVLSSFSSWTIKYWTDGESNIGFSNVFTPLVRCPLCQSLFWKSDATELGYKPSEPSPMSRFSIWYAKITGDKEGKLAEQDAWNVLPMELKNAPRYIPSELEDWLEVLQDTSNLTPEREATARRVVWRNSNDHNRLRSDGQPWKVEPALCCGEATANRLALLHLIENDSPSAPTEKAELLRQLGRFDEAILLLESASQEAQQAPLAFKIVRLAKAGDTVVSEV